MRSYYRRAAAGSGKQKHFFNCARAVSVSTRRSGLGCARCTHTREDKESRLSWEGMTYGK